jgi:N utilization substance protein B
MSQELLSKEEALKLLPGDEELEEGPLFGPPPQSRHYARELALKLIYACEISGLNWQIVIGPLKNLQVEDQRYLNFSLKLVEKVRKGSKKIDQLIVRRSEKWDFARIAIVDKLILRIAIAELLFFDDIPPKVTINEAIEIAKRYSTDNSSRFVNGVLDGIYSDIKDQIKCD